MNTADTKIWKDIISKLQTNIEENKAMIEEIKEQIVLQEERNKKEIQRLADEARAQQKDLEDLLAQVDSDELFSLPSDQEARVAFVESLKQRIDQSKQIVDYAQTLLNTPAATQETIEKIRRTAPAIPAVDPTAVEGFDASSLLGNWIHYFQKDIFTCQSFWDDKAFKEFDFRGTRLDADRGGTYEVKDGKVILTYDDGKKDEYAVTGYSVDCMDYLIDGRPYRFDYMPEDLLNSLLEQASKEQA